MNNTLMVYLNKRMHEHDPKYMQGNSQPGPVICISREVGCGGVALAGLLADELDKLTFCKKWKVISKEILEQSARELNMTPNRLKNLLKEGDRGMIDSILSAFSEKRYKSDKKINNTLIDLIFSFASDGYCIIVGRAGHVIAREIGKSLFIKLTAPYDWRVKQIMKKNDLKMREAIEFIDKTEIERHNLVKRIADEKHIDTEFDLIIDLSRMSIPDVISIIQFAAQTKGLLEPKKSKVEVF
jgi:cytidylate kinase